MASSVIRLSTAELLPAAPPPPASAAEPFRAASALANWVWLAELPQCERALVLDARQAAPLAAHVSEVVTGSADAPLPAGPFGAVALGSVSSLVAARGLPALGALCREARARLAPGGVLALPFTSALHFRRLGRECDGALRPATVRRLLAAVGFARQTPFYVLHTFDSPAMLLPAHSEALLAMDRQFAPASRSRAAKRWLVRAGAHALLYRSMLVLAYA